MLRLTLWFSLVMMTESNNRRDEDFGEAAARLLAGLDARRDSFEHSREGPLQRPVLFVIEGGKLPEEHQSHAHV